MTPMDTPHQPVVFISHGSPMLAMENGPWHAALAAWSLKRHGIRAVLVVSAHWESPGAFRVTSAPRPGIMHDFSGFDEALYRLDYPAPGDSELAVRVVERLRGAGLDAALDARRPLDHGAWVPLRALFPEAGIPVLQVSLPRPRTPELLLKAGQALAPLRSEGVLILGSGGLVHNLRNLAWDGHPAPDPSAKAFEAWMLSRIQAQDIPALLQAADHAPGYTAAVPTTEHLDPLYTALGAAGADAASTIFDGWQHGNLSLRALAWA